MRVRLLALFSAALLFLLGAVPAQAEGEGGNHGDNGTGSYLALGDSVPFGYQPVRQLFPNADNFIGYPEIVARELDLRDVNAACPGEATGGFLSWTGTDNGCHPYRTVYPLHVGYSPPETQMEFALAYLRKHHNTRLVSLTLGANDAFVFQNSHPECFGPVPPPACQLLLLGFFTTVQSNLTTIFANIRASGYAGLIVAVTYYALNYADLNQVRGTLTLNSTMSAAASTGSNSALIADGFLAWRETALKSPANGDPCLAGLRIVISGRCDIHPTRLGHELLAKKVIQTIAASCPEHDAQGCLDRNHND